MTVAEYLVDELIQLGVKHAFGVPGGVVLRLLQAMEARKPEFEPHLTYHEQTAGFAACGYAQASGKLGVAYATRGPGITNMLTAIAEAYQESLPVLFITAHGTRTAGPMRFEYNQELDLMNCVSDFTKYARNVEQIQDVPVFLREACIAAQTGRKGPVFLDFASHLFSKEVPVIGETAQTQHSPQANSEQVKAARGILQKTLSEAKRPLILIGDGIRHTVSHEEISARLTDIGLPVISSRGSQDILSQSRCYYGYLGSHGTRYTNFILSKADLVISIGNRLAFPIHSESYAPVFQRAKLIRVDIDEGEFSRNIPGMVTIGLNAADFLSILSEMNVEKLCFKSWVNICNRLKCELDEYDITEPVQKLTAFLKQQKDARVFVCDVGNNEFWFARAFEYVRPKGMVLCSKSFGTLGVALGRAIGAYYATGKKVICIIGDQGFQYNIQELQYLAQWNIPVCIVLMNNACSGMIRDHQMKITEDRLIHVSEHNGYTIPDFSRIAKGYGIPYYSEGIIAEDANPALYEIKFDSAVSLSPNLPRGNACQDMEPLMDRAVYQYFDNL